MENEFKLMKVDTAENLIRKFCKEKEIHHIDLLVNFIEIYTAITCYFNNNKDAKKDFLIFIDDMLKDKKLFKEVKFRFEELSNYSSDISDLIFNCNENNN